MRREDLAPGAQAALAAMEAAGGPPLEELDPPAARIAHAATDAMLQAPPPAGAAHEADPVSFDVPAEPIRATVWRGAGADATGAPAILYLHGGGWVVGSPETHALICARLAAACDAVVVCPDYRLAPEARFPAAVDDTLACLGGLPALAAALGADPVRIVLAARIAIGGDSAGGNLAAVAALAAARDPDLPDPRAQLLFYPNTSARQDLSSFRRFASGFGLTAVTMRWFRDHYVSGSEIDDWRVSPLRADLSLPPAPAFIALAGADILADEGVAYAARLDAAGVPVETRLWPGHLHGFLSMSRHDPAADEAIAAAAAVLRRRLGA